MMGIALVLVPPPVFNIHGKLDLLEDNRHSNVEASPQDQQNTVHHSFLSTIPHTQSCIHFRLPLLLNALSAWLRILLLHFTVQTYVGFTRLWTSRAHRSAQDRKRHFSCENMKFEIRIKLPNGVSDLPNGVILCVFLIRISAVLHVDKCLFLSCTGWLYFNHVFRPFW